MLHFQNQLSQASKYNQKALGHDDLSINLGKMNVSDSEKPSDLKPIRKKVPLKEIQQDSGFIDEISIEEPKHPISKELSKVQEEDVVVIDDSGDFIEAAADQSDSDEDLMVPVLQQKKISMVSQATQRRCAINNYCTFFTEIFYELDFLDYYYDLLSYLHHRKQRVLQLKQSMDEQRVHLAIL
jgi:hypothetical protein